MPGLAARVEETDRWRQAEARSSGAHLGGLTGGSAGAGRRLAEAGRKLEAAPGAKQALADGKLSLDQAEQIAEAVAETAWSAKPEVASQAEEVERRLLEVAAAQDLARLRDAAAKAKQTARDEARTRRVQHDTRHLRRRAFDDGSVGGQFKLPAAVGGQLWAIVDRLAQHRFETARREGLREGRDAYAADALCLAVGVNPPVHPDRPQSGPAATATGNTHSGAPDTGPAAAGEAAAGEADTVAGAAAPGPPSVSVPEEQGDSSQAPSAAPTGAVPEPRVNLHRELVVIVDADSLRAGAVGPDGTCEIPGVGPVPVQTARELLGEAAVSIVMKQGVDIASVTLGGRRLSKAMRLAMLARHGWCCTDCQTPYALQGDHDTPYALTRHTTLSELKPRCPADHLRKTRREAAQTTAAGRERAAQARQADHTDHTRRRVYRALISILALILLTRGP